MNKEQKVKVLKSTRESFQTRLTELSRVGIPFDNNDRAQLTNRKESLNQAIHFCDYLLVTLRRNNDFKPETYSMLKFLGLEDL